MIIAACVDEAFGLQFAGRRQSRDREMAARLLSMAGGRLRIHPDAEKLFSGQDIYCAEDWLTGASDGDWCFCEDTSYLAAAGRIEQIVLFQWNRTYPADLFFQFPGEWKCTERRDFEGSSHEKITVEVYNR